MATLQQVIQFRSTRVRRHPQLAFAITVLVGTVLGVVFTFAWFLTHRPPKVTYTYADLLSPASPLYVGAPFYDDKTFWSWVQTERPPCVAPAATPETDSRCIIGQTNVSQHIWLFGNSTLNNIESPDEWIIASQLQARLPDWRVEQRTRSSATLLMDVDMLKQQAVRRGDIVVFYGLWPDVWASYNGDGNRPKAIKQALDMARAWCDERGVRLVVVVAPIIWSRPLTPVEQRWLDKVLPVWDVGNVDIERIVTIQRDLTALIPNALDMTHVLDRARDTWPMFHDAWHTSWRANGIIGEVLADAIVGF